MRLTIIGWLESLVVHSEARCIKRLGWDGTLDTLPAQSYKNREKNAWWLQLAGLTTVQVWQSYLWSERGVFNMLSDVEAV